MSVAKKAYEIQRKELRITFDLVSDVVKCALSACVPDPDWGDVGDLTCLKEKLLTTLCTAKEVTVRNGAHVAHFISSTY